MEGTEKVFLKSLRISASRSLPSPILLHPSYIILLPSYIILLPSYIIPQTSFAPTLHLIYNIRPTLQFS